VIVLGHPSRKALLRWATDGGQRDITEHLQRCDRCQAFVAHYRALQRDVGELPYPVAGDAVLTRVLASRSAGRSADERVLSPVQDAPRRFPRARYAAAAAAVAICVAAALIWTLPLGWVRTAQNDNDRGTPSGGDRGVLTGLVFPAPAGAQVLDPDPLALPPLRIDGRRVRAGVWTFERTVTTNGILTEPVERGVIAISPDRVNGRTAWKVTNEWQGHPYDLHETTWYSVLGLVPVQRVATNVGHSHWTVEQTIAPPRLTGWIYRPGVRRRIERELPRRATVLLAGEGAPLLFFQGVSLGTGWSTTVFRLGWGDQPEDLLYPLRLVVTGEDRITVPAGTFDCWRLDASGMREIWVRKADGIPVRIQDITRSATRAQSVLASEQIARTQ
jgi:hypothetical protein